MVLCTAVRFLLYHLHVNAISHAVASFFTAYPPMLCHLSKNLVYPLRFCYLNILSKQELVNCSPLCVTQNTLTWTGLLWNPCPISRCLKKQCMSTAAKVRLSHVYLLDIVSRQLGKKSVPSVPAKSLLTAKHTAHLKTPSSAKKIQFKCQNIHFYTCM